LGIRPRRPQRTQQKNDLDPRLELLTASNSIAQQPVPTWNLIDLFKVVHVYIHQYSTTAGTCYRKQIQTQHKDAYGSRGDYCSTSIMADVHEQEKRKKNKQERQAAMPAFMERRVVLVP
jgi:hypothetical protein